MLLRVGGHTGSPMTGMSSGGRGGGLRKRCLGSESAGHKRNREVRMSKTPNENTTRAARRMLYCAVGAALLSIPTLAVADETFSLQQVVVIPGAPLVSFDISFVDPGLNQYFLADRSNASIDIIDVNSFHVRQIIPPAPNNFVGNTGVSVTSGPNGVLTLSARGPDDFWTD